MEHNDLATIEKLEDMLNKRALHDFDDEDVEVLHRVIRMVRGFDALGSFAEFVSKTITWLGIVIGGFIAFKTGFLDFIWQAVHNRI